MQVYVFSQTVPNSQTTMVMEYHHVNSSLACDSGFADAWSRVPED